MGLIERAEEVFAGGQVNGGLAAYGGIDAGKQGRGYLNQFYAAQIGGGGKARKVAYHAAAEGEDHIGAGKAAFGEKIDHIYIGIYIFAGLACGKDVFGGAETGVYKRIFKPFCVERRYIGIGDNCGGASGKLFCDITGFVEQSAADDYLAHLPSTSSFMRLPSSSSVRSVLPSWVSIASRYLVSSEIRPSISGMR